VIATVEPEHAIHVLARLGIRRDTAETIHGGRTGVVGGQGVTEVSEAIDHGAQIAASREDVLGRAHRISNSERPRRPGHELHEALCTFARDGIWLEVRLGPHHRFDQRRRHPMDHAGPGDQVVVAGRPGPSPQRSRQRAWWNRAPDRGRPVTPETAIRRNVGEVHDSLFVDVPVHPGKYRFSSSGCACSDPERQEPGAPSCASQRINLPSGSRSKFP